MKDFHRKLNLIHSNPAQMSKYCIHAFTIVLGVSNFQSIYFRAPYVVQRLHRRSVARITSFITKRILRISAKIRRRCYRRVKSLRTESLEHILP